MANRDIITIGASAGGVEALTELAASLPADLPASVFAVVHLSAQSPSMLSEVLGRRSALPVEQASDRAEIRRGRIYVAPPDQHLMIDRSYIYLTRGPRENRVRPSVDPLFRSAAVVHGPHVIGVVLSGTLDDGTSGMVAIKRCGGVAVVQDPDDAAFSDMPRSAIEHTEVDYRVPVSQMAQLLVRLAEGVPGKPLPPPQELLAEVEIARSGKSTTERTDEIGDLVPLTCAECGGPLWQIRGDRVLRFRCREGHSYTAKTLVSEMSDNIEQSLWVAVQTMDERTRMLERLAESEMRREHERSAASFRNRAEEARRHANHLREFLLSLNQR